MRRLIALSGKLLAVSCLVWIGAALSFTASDVQAQSATATPVYVIITNTPQTTPAASPVYLVVTSTPIPSPTPAPVYVVVTSTYTFTPSPVVPTPGNPQTAVAATATTAWINFRDQFVFQRMFDDSQQTYWARSYSYGSTDYSTKRVHHGLDISNPVGTPVLSAGYGTVAYAGDDYTQLFGPLPNFYGNVVVILHPVTDGLGRPVYTLYGHLSSIMVATGDVVQSGQVIGIIGAAGIAAGTHLHFEVRAGDMNDYNAVLNPELWIKPSYNRGVIVGRVLDSAGNPAYGVQVTAAGDPGTLQSFSYVDTTVGSDPILRENFVIADVPAGEYAVFIRDDYAKVYSGKAEIIVEPGRSSWVELRLK